MSTSDLYDLIGFTGPLRVFCNIIIQIIYTSPILSLTRKLMTALVVSQAVMYAATIQSTKSWVEIAKHKLKSIKHQHLSSPPSSKNGAKKEKSYGSFMTLQNSLGFSLLFVFSNSHQAVDPRPPKLLTPPPVLDMRSSSSCSR